jgi:hypothetical protein
MFSMRSMHRGHERLGALVHHAVQRLVEALRHGRLIERRVIQERQIDRLVAGLLALLLGLLLPRVAGQERAHLLQRLALRFKEPLELADVAALLALAFALARVAA